MNRRKYKLILAAAHVLFLLAVVLIQFGLNLELFYLASVVYVVTILVCQFSLRCPNCGRLPKHGIIWTKHCPHCGEEMDDEETTY